jgi:uncharacterized protein
MSSVAIAIICKTPTAGASKTRLSPPLTPQECAALSACFIRDLSQTIQTLVDDGRATGYAIYTPLGSEAALRPLLPQQFRLLPQVEGSFGVRLLQATIDLLEAGHTGAILLNSDSPTLPSSILRAAVDAVREDNVVLSPAHDGGYTLIGLSKPHARLFEDIPWSTSAVRAVTLERARELGLPVAEVPGWYDVDDATSLRMLEAEMRGEQLAGFPMGIAGAEAPATRRFLLERQAASDAEPPVRAISQRR